jgi:hypothetical protein
MSVVPPQPGPQYEDELRTVLAARDWLGLREFSHRRNEIPADVYEQGQHFWEVLMHKLTVNRFDLLGYHEESRAWLLDHGYTTDLGGY